MIRLSLWKNLRESAENFLVLIRVQFASTFIKDKVFTWWQIRKYNGKYIENKNKIPSNILNKKGVVLVCFWKHDELDTLKGCLIIIKL